jgi:DNA-binding NarL/FixJ family response regulator
MSQILHNDIQESLSYLSECIWNLAQRKGMEPHEAIKEVISTGLQKLGHESSSEANSHYDLSSKQKVVLELLRKGLAVKEIAHEMKISEVTVRTHIQRIRVRLGCSDLLALRMR